MIKYFCDKCGDEVNKYSGAFTVTIQSPAVGVMLDDVQTGAYVLCRDCIKEFNKFMMERKAKKL